MEKIGIYSSVPFIVLLFLIATMPYINERLWGKNYIKLLVSVILSVPVIISLHNTENDSILTEHMLFDYIPFIILLGSLFVISGGIYISVYASGKPQTNLIFMIAGALLASFIGTTGASMLLIRPLIRSNENRKEKQHLILFFIAIVSNTGGLLTPLGDPALFILYLQGIPFNWFFKLWPQWIVINGLLIGLFYFTDSMFYKRTMRIKPFYRHHRVRLHIRGTINLFWLSGIILATLFINETYIPEIRTNVVLAYSREFVILLMAGLSLIFSGRHNFHRNAFSWGPIIEIAILFLGIFITMIPALIYLEQNISSIAFNSTGEFYFSTGFLSSFLDNTPTAAIFHSIAKNLKFDAVDSNIVFISGVNESLLKAISLGAVAFGSLTYIGNGPNFMVKAIAENNGIKMPGFFMYILKFSMFYLLPVYIAIYFLFL